MKALIIYAHPRKESFSYALLTRVTAALEKKNYEVEVRDLYAMNFNPILNESDMIYTKNQEFVRENSEYPEDVKVEQKLIEESELLIYLFPIWWNGMPAIMKGYIDRVFQHGFAYSFTSEDPKQRFAGKRALFLTPTGQPQSDDGEDTKITKAIKTLTSEWLFNSIDVEIIDHVFYGRVPYLSREELEKYLVETEELINEKV
ncbi:NAD(P)H-dependent oxidoreductase [Jeotgalibaca caeni]|uniref:NAD(P)H-dependent oxidoreductase n=1 Tax=Jeotgalibaca caeni TaxID=3028623 RepID=UPI00237E0DC1|nr:NAD(P)H-dependent oxidoreductase [Jeotgalibaca caeni]MDE1549300.1 NAD(P)H-dependent oxidoreductase [Jeotgalibaca caeni]